MPRQRPELPVVAFLLLPKLDTTLAKERISAFRKGLQEEGFVEGTNYSLAVRSAEGDFTRLPQLGGELGKLNPHVFVTLGFGAAPAQRSFPEIPLVFASVAADPIALGWVESYAHPGGMITGNVMNAVGGEESMTQMRIGLFKQLVPSLTRLGTIAPANGVLALKEKEALQKVATQMDFEFVLYFPPSLLVWAAPSRELASASPGSRSSSFAGIPAYQGAFPKSSRVQD